MPGISNYSHSRQGIHATAVAACAVLVWVNLPQEALAGCSHAVTSRLQRDLLPSILRSVQGDPRDGTSSPTNPPTTPVPPGGCADMRCGDRASVPLRRSGKCGSGPSYSRLARRRPIRRQAAPFLDARRPPFSAVPRAPRPSFDHLESPGGNKTAHPRRVPRGRPSHSIGTFVGLCELCQDTAIRGVVRRRCQMSALGLRRRCLVAAARPRMGDGAPGASTHFSGTSISILFILISEFHYV